MAKKSQNPPQPEPLTAAKKPAKPKAAKAAPKAPKTVAAPKTTVAPAAVAAPAKAKPAAVKAKPGSSKTKITAADIELRAYFIAEKRHKLGIPGDSTSDWVEAERQLKAEASVKPIL